LAFLRHLKTPESKTLPTAMIAGHLQSRLEYETYITRLQSQKGFADLAKAYGTAGVRWLPTPGPRESTSSPSALTLSVELDYHPLSRVAAV